MRGCAWTTRTAPPIGVSSGVTRRPLTVTFFPYDALAVRLRFAISAATVAWSVALVPLGAPRSGPGVAVAVAACADDESGFGSAGCAGAGGQPLSGPAVVAQASL